MWKGIIKGSKGLRQKGRMGRPTLKKDDSQKWAIYWPLGPQRRQERDNGIILNRAINTPNGPGSDSKIDQETRHKPAKPVTNGVRVSHKGSEIASQMPQGKGGMGSGTGHKLDKRDITSALKEPDRGQFARDLG